jgi:nicotinamidase-related amidase
MRRLSLVASCALAVLLPGVPAASAQTIIDEWRSIAVPPPPELQPVTVDPAHTALLILDMNGTACSDRQRPRCAHNLPNVQKLLADARAHKMLVVYSTGVLVPGVPPNPPADAIAPQQGEPILHAPVDKFVDSDLEKILKDRGINTVIVTGTSADGAVLYTASHATELGMTAIVPVDGMSSINPFAELYTAYHLKNTAASVSQHTTLTRANMISYK